MLALMTDHCDRFDAQPATTASTPMSSQLREPSFDCDPNLASLTPAAIMPVLLHHSKRKRLDAVLTKLSLSSCKDESFLLGDEAAELAKEHVESESSRRASLIETVHQNDASLMFPTEQQEETRDKTPQKQRSVDSEMAQECRLMALDDQRSTKSLQSLTHSRVSRESSFNSSSTEHEVTDTTTVMRHTSVNLFGAHRQQLQLPRAKLVTRRRVPDTNSRTESAARVVESGPSSAPPFCTSLLSRTYLGLSCDTLPSFPICECSHCRTLCSQTSSKMPTLSSVTPSHHHPWSWHSLKQESPHMLIDPFTYLLSTNSKLARDKPSSPIMPIPSSPPQVLSSSLGKHELNLIELAAQRSSKLMENQKKRSHSDSDMTHEYLSLFNSLAAQKEVCLPHLQPSEPGVLLKNGRRVPKPLSKTTAIHHSSEQDSPLDLSVKYADLISAPEKQSAFGTSSSVPSLHTLSNKPFRFSDSSSAESVTLSDFSLRAMPLALHKAPFKRSNISGSDSLNSSSLSSISSLSPPYLPSAEAKSPKVPRARFEFSEERGNSNLADSNEPESVSSSNHVCTLCGQSFLYYDRLAKHMASRHRKSGDTVKNYQCGICSRSFARSDMLTRHMRLHTGHKPYTCGICDQVFSRSDHLSTHQRTHTGDKPYKCPQCPYAACRRDMITRHMKTHSRYEIPDSSTKSA